MGNEYRRKRGKKRQVLRCSRLCVQDVRWRNSRAFASRAEDPGFNSRSRHIRDLLLEPIQSVGAEWTLKLCLRTNIWIYAGQALVAAITVEAKRLLSLDLSSLRDGSQLPGRAAITNYGQLQYTRTQTDTCTHTHTRVPCVG
jgi:hypothetical protein